VVFSSAKRRLGSERSEEDEYKEDEYKSITPSVPKYKVKKGSNFVPKYKVLEG
jgi:hypothetical protein